MIQRTTGARRPRHRERKQLFADRDVIARLCLQLEHDQVRAWVAGQRAAQAELTSINQQLGKANAKVDTVHEAVRLAGRVVEIVRRCGLA